MSLLMHPHSCLLAGSSSVTTIGGQLEVSQASLLTPTTSTMTAPQAIDPSQEHPQCTYIDSIVPLSSSYITPQSLAILQQEAGALGGGRLA